VDAVGAGVPHADAGAAAGVAAGVAAGAVAGAGNRLVLHFRHDPKRPAIRAGRTFSLDAHPLIS
jgi:hypothetical protein